VTVDLQPAEISLKDFAGRLRRSMPPLIGAYRERALQIDLRTIFLWQDTDLIRLVREATAQSALGST
jgi:hypothetical protein